MNITIIDDEKILAEKTSKKLEKNGYCVCVFHSCTDFYNSYFSESDLYIIDLWLWDGSWFDIIRWLREKNISAPIIITSGYADSEKKIYWLDLWADDYMTKPFIPEELLARVKAQLRRKDSVIDKSTIIRYANIEFHIESSIVMLWKRKIKLTKKEIQLLHLFLMNIWKIIAKNKIIYSVWNSSDFTSVSDNTINVTMWSLRKKLWKKFKLTTLIHEWYMLEQDSTK